MAIEIGKNTFQRYLWDIYKGGYTGILRVERKKLWKDISFDKGIPVAGRSNMLKECLGRLLVKSGELSEDKCYDSLILKKGLKLAQGETLIKMGFLKKEQLPALLRLQFKSRLIDLFGWKDCTYRFTNSEVTPFVHLEETVGALIIEGVKERYLGLEEELNPLGLKYLKRSRSFDNVLSDFGLKAIPVGIDGKRVDQILSLGREPASLLYSLIMTKAFCLTDTSEDFERLMLFREKIAGRNCLETLEVSQDASDSDVKKAYFKLAKLYHPDLYETSLDRSVRSISNEIFCQISAAYGVLSNEKSRQDYMEQLNKGYSDSKSVMASRIMTAEMEFNKGQTFIRAKNFIDAEKCFKKAADMNPDEGEFYGYLGWAIYNKPGKSSEEVELAKKYITKAISMNSRIAIVYYFLGYIHRVEGNLKAALREFEKALRLDPKMAEPLIEIRLINSRKEKDDKSEKNKGIFNKIFR